MTTRMKPILFSSQMARSILAGEKTVTRRVIKRKFVDDALRSPARKSNPDIPDEKFVRCLCDAPYEPGDILWVREAWRLVDFEYVDGDFNASVEYRADGTIGARLHNLTVNERAGWRPSIYMPRAAARIFLRVKDVRAERLQDGFSAPISPIFALQSEGIDIGETCRVCIETYGSPCCVDTVDEDGTDLYGGECGVLDDVRSDFADLWDGINSRRDGGAYAWERNPWVWVIEFERVEGEP